MRLTNVGLEYPLDSSPRYGHGRPAHQALVRVLERERERYEFLLRQFPAASEGLAAIPRERQNARDPHWGNGYFVGLDAVALYSMLAILKPKRYMEIGSGYSTKFARRAIMDHGLCTRIVALDPEPRAEIADVADEIIGSPLEASDLALFDSLEAGDFLFIDSSHRSFMNSDVTVIFLELLPRLKPGVIVHFHDIWLPIDYAEEWAGRGYNEQYLLACCLLYGNALTPEMPVLYISEFGGYARLLDPIWRFAPRTRWQGVSFWCRTAARF
jgi:predicted O-methyltransferase YrrM